MIKYIEVFPEGRSLQILPKWASPIQASYIVGLSKSTLYNILRDAEGKIRTKAFSRTGSSLRKVRLISIDDLLKFIENLPETTNK
jgi:hypothetical protein